MALSLPAATQSLVIHGNALVTEFQHQKLSINNVLSRQQEIGQKIQEMIAGFKVHDVMKAPKKTLAVLQEVKTNFNVVRNNINTLDAKEKEMSNLIQNIIARQNEGNTKSSEINRNLTDVNNKLRATQVQINSTQASLNNMAAELRQLQRNIEDTERRIQQKKTQSYALLAASILTLGMGAAVTAVAGVGTVVSFKDLESARNELGNRQNMYAATEASQRNLQNIFNQNSNLKRQLEHEQKIKQFELKMIAEALKKLDETLPLSIDYKHRLLDVSDKFNEVNSYTENLKKNLDTVVEIQEAGHSPETLMTTTITKDYNNLAFLWIVTRNNGITARNNLGSRLEAYNPRRFSAEAGGRRTVKSAHNTFLRAYNNEWKVDLAPNANIWERWYIEDWKGRVVFKAIHSPGRFLRASPDGSVDLTPHHPREWETWMPFKNDDGSWSFLSFHGRWLCASADGTVSTKENCQAQEHFRLGRW